jgi:peptidyl-tRNA hydrolase, PTH1 family
VALVLGLGNPGERYARTRHNAGWQVVDELVRRTGAVEIESDETFREWRASDHGRSLSLVKPLTYMNESGEALARWRARREEAVAEPADDEPPAATELLVVTDDVYLPVGVVRLRARGSSGGHQGLESIARTLGSNDFARLRVGVGAVESAALRTYVLDEPRADEAAALETAIGVAADAVECWLGDGLLAAMNRFNRKAGKEAPDT